MKGARDQDETALLLSRCRAGDRDALRALVLRDVEWIRSYVHRHLDGVVRDHADTDDVVQEVMVRVLESGPSFVVDSQEVCRRLIGRIVANSLASMARRYGAAKRSPGRGRSQRNAAGDTTLYLPGDGPAKRVTEPDARVAKAEEAERVRLAMELLGARDHEVLLLRDWERMSFVDIGSRLGLKEDAARMCYRRALQKMSRFLLLIQQGQVEQLLEEVEVASPG